MVEYLLLLVCLALGGYATFLQKKLGDSRAAIAELKQSQDKLQQSQAQVIHTTKLASLGQMIAGVAHEMNTPIGFVKSNVEVVRELLGEQRQRVRKCNDALDKLRRADLGKPEAQLAMRGALGKLHAALGDEQRVQDSDELLKDSVDGLQQIASLVRNLKGFARVDSDGMDVLDLNECVESALVIAGHQLRDRIEVHKELATLPKVRGVASQLNQVLLNLITNAAQAMGESGKLTVVSRRAGDNVEIDVSDTGPGIPDEVLPKIFDPFFTTKAVGEGTGLGLSIVHKIVQGHRGSIKVRTAPNNGSTFTITFPVDHQLLKRQT